MTVTPSPNAGLKQKHGDDEPAGQKRADDIHPLRARALAGHVDFRATLIQQLLNLGFLHVRAEIDPFLAFFLSLVRRMLGLNFIDAGVRSGRDAGLTEALVAEQLMKFGSSDFAGMGAEQNSGGNSGRASDDDCDCEGEQLAVF